MRTSAKLRALVFGLIGTMFGGAGAARAEVGVSNFGLSPLGTEAIAAGWTHATSFTTGSGDAWKLNSVKFVMSTGLSFANFSVTIRADDNGAPGAVLHTLPTVGLPQGIGSGVVAFEDPNAALTLNPSTTYWVAALNESGFGFISPMSNTDQYGLSGWSIGDGSLIHVSGTWIDTGSVAAMEVDVTPIVFVPEVTAVYGCTQQSGNVTIDCPVDGNIEIQLLGNHFTPNTDVLVGGTPVLSTQFYSEHELRCIIGPGTYQGLPVTVIDEKGWTTFPNAVSYEDVRCRGDGNLDGFVDFEDITETLANWYSSCN